MNIVEKKAKSKNSIGHSTMVCRHCGGKVRYYMGDYSCLMCGREIGHTCKGCPSIK
jgi:Ribonuclease G/E